MIINKRGVALLEAVTAVAVMGLVTLALTGLLMASVQISAAAQAVTRGRLLAQSHIELARGGKDTPTLEADGLVSNLETIEINGYLIWRVEVKGELLPKPVLLYSGQ